MWEGDENGQEEVQRARLIQAGKLATLAREKNVY
jgi:hypothetical protein